MDTTIHFARTFLDKEGSKVEKMHERVQLWTHFFSKNPQHIKVNSFSWQKSCATGFPFSTCYDLEARLPRHCPLKIGLRRAKLGKLKRQNSY